MVYLCTSYSACIVCLGVARHQWTALVDTRVMICSQTKCTRKEFLWIWMLTEGSLSIESVAVQTHDCTRQITQMILHTNIKMLRRLCCAKCLCCSVFHWSPLAAVLDGIAVCQHACAHPSAHLSRSLSAAYLFHSTFACTMLLRFFGFCSYRVLQ